MSADPGLLKGIPAETAWGTRVSATGPLVHRCPVVPEVDAGEVTVSWTVGELTLELHALTAYLASWADQEVSHEEITEQIRADLDEGIDGIDDVTVETRWRTGGLAVVVRTRSTLPEVLRHQ
jgi:NADPH-dependent 7-cyano-7-deazaguanine reductase QueF